MIQFDFHWSDPFNLIILALAAALLPMQVWMALFRRSEVVTSRHWIRLVLNVLLWLVVIAFILQPFVIREAKAVTGFLVGKDVPQKVANALKDSLTKADHIISDDLKKGSADTLILAGQDFGEATFASIMRSRSLPKAIHLIPYQPHDQLQTLHWKGILRHGEMQVVQGSVLSSKKQMLKLSYGGETLDSTILTTGLNDFKLQFPAFAEGRTAVELLLADHIQDTLRFFARPSEKRTFQFVLDSPDFESRALANWLGKSGHAVVYNTTLSKDIASQQTINKGKVPEVVITDAGNAGNALVKKHLAKGKSVLFINLTDPAMEIRAINAALGTTFTVRKISDKESVSISSGLTAMPFEFIGNKQYFVAKAYPVAVERLHGIVGVSLLNETFPLQLQGDSTAYQRTWDAILALTQPAVDNNVELEAPLYRSINAEISLNSFQKMPEFLRIGQDTLFTNISALNSKSATARFMPTEPGWLHSNDSLNIELYVENPEVANGLYNTTKVTAFIKAFNASQNHLQESNVHSKAKGVRREVSEWMWFSLLMICFVALWVERKLS